MKRLLFVWLVSLSFFGFNQDYFQQRVDYTIEVKLNDFYNTLSAYEEFVYTNHSDQTLDFIYIHLWPNAYKNNQTALAKQLYDNNNMVLEYARAGERGYIDSLDFQQDGKSIKWEYDPEHIDIAKIWLNTPLKPGEKTTISTPFKVKIPSGEISRMGYVGESFQITQWYPKPAVFDKNGWHQMPYLNQGEFYSEYGSFDVSITLPANYVVGATGDLQTESEIEFLDEKAAETAEHYEKNKFKTLGKNSFPESDTTYKTIRYTQDNVHDFGWFADKRFEVLKGEVELPHSGRKVTSYCMFVPTSSYYESSHQVLWENSIEYINDGVYYYSLWNGDYPYNTVTAVDGTISAGGGMEYPNVTVIGNVSSKAELEVVIVHEVGHNWFYGQLGSNEREHPWMDEGLNTLNEIRYIETKYPNNEHLSDMMQGRAQMLHLEHLNHHDMNDLSYTAMAGSGKDQPIELPSADYTSINYGAIVYSKTGIVFNYVRDYLGDSLFDACMQEYYKEWEFKHPQPEDIKATFESVSGKNLDWLFVDLIQTTKQIDYKVSRVKVTDVGTEVTIKNKGQINSPVRVDVYSLGKYRNTIWIDSCEKKTTVTFEEKTLDEIRVDGFRKMPEVNRNNNTNMLHKIEFKKVEPIKIEFLAGDNEADYTEIWTTPIVGYNVYDQLMVGMLFHNISIPKNKFEYTLAPMYSFGRNMLSGTANFRYTQVPAKNFSSIVYGVKGKTFKNRLSLLNNEYYVVNPYVTFNIGKPDKKVNYSQKLNVKGVYLYEHTKDGSTYINQTTVGGQAEYQFKYAHRIHGFQASLKGDYLNQLDNNIQVSNLNVDAEYKLQYWDKKNKFLKIRAYLGYNLLTQGGEYNIYAFTAGGQTGNQDYFYEQTLMGRNEYNGFWAQQRINNQGNMKTLSTFGTNNQWLFTTNYYMDLPYIKFIGLYADLGLVDLNGSIETMYDFGVGFELMDGNFGVYLPIYESDNLKSAYSSDIEYQQKIRFTLNLNAFNPDKLIQSVF